MAVCKNRGHKRAERRARRSVKEELRWLRSQAARERARQDAADIKAGMVIPRSEVNRVPITAHNLMLAAMVAEEGGS